MDGPVRAGRSSWSPSPPCRAQSRAVTALSHRSRGRQRFGRRTRGSLEGSGDVDHPVTIDVSFDADGQVAALEDERPTNGSPSASMSRPARLRRTRGGGRRSGTHRCCHRCRSARRWCGRSGTCAPWCGRHRRTLRSASLRRRCRGSQEALGGIGTEPMCADRSWTRTDLVRGAQVLSGGYERGQSSRSQIRQGGVIPETCKEIDGGRRLRCGTARSARGRDRP